MVLINMGSYNMFVSNEQMKNTGYLIGYLSLFILLRVQYEHVRGIY